MGKHFRFSSWTMTSSEANLPTLAMTLQLDTKDNTLVDNVQIANVPQRRKRSLCQ